ncbi:MAG: hypothetical protein JW837_17195 [Sedimentisphaerales bacterium]|nr:hypothetical protein [Sedimentisphaerales bacterium]
MSEASDNNYKSFFVRWYFYITPLFMVLDYFWGYNFRISALDTEPAYKYLYYGFCILCGVLMYIFPTYSAIAALFESSINAMLLILNIYLPYVRTLTGLMDDVLEADFNALQESLTIDPVINLFIAVCCIVLTFRTSIYRISGSVGYDGTS